MSVPRLLYRRWQAVADADTSGVTNRRVSLARAPQWWVQVAVALVIVVGVNAAALWAWGAKAPWLTLFPSVSSADAEPVVTVDVVDASVVPSGFVPGAVFARDVLKTAPSPGDRFAPADAAAGTLQYGAVTMCGTRDTVVPPVVTAQRSWRKAANASGGFVQQVQLLPAGMGAVSFDQHAATAATCPGVTVTYATSNTLAYNVDLDGWSGRFVVARDGDMLAVLAVDGVDMDLVPLMSQWRDSWGDVIGLVCLDRDADVSAAQRQPLSPSYRGFEEVRTVTLTSRQRDRITADVLEQWGGRKQRDVTEPLYDAVVLPSPMSLPSIPYGITVDIADEPLIGAAPTAPGVAPDSAEFRGVVRDDSGPGCGWKWLAQPPAPFDADAARRGWEAAEETALRVAEADFASWVKSGFQYAQAVADYAAAVAWYDRWVSLVQDRVVVAAWEAYKLEQARYAVELKEWQTLEEQYVLDRNAWQRCRALNPEPAPTPAPSPSPSPSPSPAPSPSPSPTPWVDPCGEAPTAPERPVKPEPPASGKPTVEQRMRAALTADDVRDGF